MCFNYRPSKQSSFYDFGVFGDCRGAGEKTLDNVFLRVYFNVFRQSSRFHFRTSKQSSFYGFGVYVDSRGGFYVVGVFVASRGRETPVKRIHEGLF